MAGRQRGLVHVQQLHAAGFGRPLIARMVVRGQLYRELRVYSVGHQGLGPFGDELAALLHFGHDVVLSHRSAAAVWGLIYPPPDRIELTLIGRDMRPRANLRTYRVAALDTRRRATQEPASRHSTRPDAGRPSRERAHARARARDRRGSRPKPGHRPRPGAGAGPRAGQDRRREAEGAREHRREPSVDADEDRATAAGAARAAGLPTPETNAWINGYEVDFLWRAQSTGGGGGRPAVPRMVQRGAFERERRRDRTHARGGLPGAAG